MQRMKRFATRRSVRPTREQGAQQIEEAVKRVFNPQLMGQLKHSTKLRDQLPFVWPKIFKKLLPLGGTSTGNNLTLYNNGSDAFTDMWNSIDNAKEKVWMETYILEPDTVGQKTLHRLTEAAKRGCDVRLIYDYVGSRKITNAHLWPLRSWGAEVVVFNPLVNWPWKIRLFGLFRNHRKILLVDDHVGYTGGMNVGDEYAGPEVGGNGFFRDTHVKVEGPAVDDLKAVFLNSLSEAKVDYVNEEVATEHPDVTPLTKKITNDNGGVFVQLLQSNRWRNKRHIQKAFILTLRKSQSHCYISSAYFLPPYRLRQAIISAAKRGVDVRILTSGVSDVPMVQMASQHVYELFLKNGVKIYELMGSALHAKTVTSDGIYGSIGSFNVDPWSHYYNLELNLTTLDPKTARKLEEDFQMDLKSSEQVTIANLRKRSMTQKVCHWAIYHMLRVFYIW